MHLRSTGGLSEADRFTHGDTPLRRWHTTQVLRPRTGTRISYQKLGSKFCTPDTQETGTRNMASDTSCGTSFLFQTDGNNQLAIAAAILEVISVKQTIKENKHKRM